MIGKINLATHPCEFFFVISQNLYIYRKRKELDLPQNARHEKDVYSIVNMPQNMVNPFETDAEITDMIRLSSGIVATPDVKADLLGTKQQGECRLLF